MEIYHPKDEELLREMRRVRRSAKRKRLIWGFVIWLLLSIAAGIILFNRFYMLSVVQGPAMGDTLPAGSLVLVRRAEQGKSYEAGDILLYQTDKVPVGADQKQHIELTCDIAKRFNGLYGDVFKIPEGFIPKNGARVMSLQNPLSKMSKSDENVNGCVHLLDAPEVIMKKFKRAVTDSEACVRYAEGKDGVNNLMTIYSAVTGKTFEQIEAEFEGKGYGDFKTAVGEAVVEELRPIRERYEKLISDKAYLEDCYRKADELALRISSRTLGKAMKKIGFVK